MPAAIPPHREAPLASGEHRAAMLELAIDGEPRLRCDRRELQRDGPSYSVLSLEELRGELGERQSLALVMGADALLSLPAWHRWRDILDLAHVIAIARPGWAWPESGAVAALLRERGAGAADLAAAAAGRVHVATLRPQAVSATAIRSLIQSRRSPRYLLPDVVLEYLRRHRLYDAPPAMPSAPEAPLTEE
jgi:nicotinate-nucleotide adenylyltransferase